MLTRNTLLIAMMNYGVITKTKRISPRYSDRLLFNPNLIQALLEYTKFLRYNAPLKARLRCLLDGVNHQPVCACGNVLKMRLGGRFDGTFPSHCSNKCTANDIDVKQKRYWKPISAPSAQTS